MQQHVTGVSASIKMHKLLFMRIELSDANTNTPQKLRMPRPRPPHTHTQMINFAEIWNVCKKCFAAVNKIDFFYPRPQNARRRHYKQWGCGIRQYLLFIEICLHYIVCGIWNASPRVPRPSAHSTFTARLCSGILCRPPEAVFLCPQHCCSTYFPLFQFLLQQNGGILIYVHFTACVSVCGRGMSTGKFETGKAKRVVGHGRAMFPVYTWADIGWTLTISRLK